jgi:hypothetical protein
VVIRFPPKVRRVLYLWQLKSHLRCSVRMEAGWFS